ncbi:P-loop containing nucleoside triphosphate hydrolase protein [Karstenula rhodostoma CBS 690.94]|uniref:P-loop containing nucleoside triphosphate hydrolase protein n=1 Tax=Karstenula rhodostoma CBS 690.94 TaxID=1392251 RepID=A0A9P4U5K1_9PLEO|nr:P-loop containing nucleoside triphosphate hydrolase protein [Karstenula rhodostoma CBS 690.94]
MDGALRLLANVSETKDDFFKPALHGHDVGFDFTLLFERSILSILPSALFLIYAPLRAFWLRCEQRKAKWNRLVIGKQLLYVLLFAAQLSLLVFTATSRGIAGSQSAIAAHTLLVAVVLALSGLSLFEHVRSPRSSDAINVYLFFSTIFDVVQLRTSWLCPLPATVSIAASACVAFKVVLLIAEAQDKFAWLMEDFRSLAPETLSGVYARRVFWWLNGLMNRGYRATFRPMDLMAIKEEFGSKRLLAAPQSKFDEEVLFRICLRAFKLDVAFLVVPRTVMLALSYTQPFLFQAIIAHLDKPSEDRDPNVGYGLIAATGLLYLSLAISKTYYQHKTYQLVTMVRGALVSMLYARTLESAPGALSDRAPVTLMSVDVDGVTDVVPVYNEIWAGIVEIGIAVYLLRRQLGVVWVVPFGVAFLSSGLAVYLSRQMSPRQAKWNAATQERVSATSIVLGFVKSIKMMGFAKYVIKDIQALREKEIRTFKVFRRYTVFLNALGNLPFYAGPVLTFTVFALLGKGKFTVERAFTSLTLISLLEISTLRFIASLPQVAAAAGCLKRLEEFFSEVHPVRSIDSSVMSHLDDNESMEDNEPRAESVNNNQRLLFSFQDVTLKTGPNVNSFSLHDVNLGIHPGQFVGLSGPAGCGKTTLIKALLNRLPHIDGRHIQRPDELIMYCAQTPWIPSGTVRDAIIGQTRPDEQWYSKVIDACALTEDFKSLNAADQTDVGSQGTNLSGGQKQRVALARALFSRRRILILDDILSGMDAHTTAYICRAVFSTEGLLRELGATVIVASHSPNVIRLMDTVLSFTLDGHIEQLQSPQDIIAESETSSHLTQLIQAVDNGAYINGEDTKTVSTGDPEEIDTARKIEDWTLYKHYIQSVGWWRFGLLAGTHLLTVWLKQWSSVVQTPTAPDRTSFYLSIYGVAALLGLFCILFGIWFIYMVMIPAAGKNMHNTLLDTVIHAKQSFHDTTPTGTTLNRFTQDMQHLDRDVPSGTLRTMHATAQCLAALVLLSISASYTAALIPLLLVALYYLQKFYLRTSRQLRLLDIEARAPLLTVFQETVDGLDTIVPLAWCTKWKETLFTTLDASQKPYYLLFCIQRWLILVLGFVVAAMATVLVTFAIQVNGLSSAGSIGVGLIALLNFNDRLNQLIVEWTSLETSLGAIARLKAFSQDTAVEEDAPGGVIPDLWPSQGSVVFRNVSAKYRDDLPPVLNNLSFDIPAGSTCAIVGRTGSGKSSTLSVLLRLLDPSSGSILIDGTPHTSAPLQNLRSRIACLPQQPYLLPGSLRRNLDPDAHRTDADHRTALERVRLWPLFAASAQSSSLAPILDHPLKPTALSPGQTQLLVLARTLLIRPRPRILILDEVTSSLDEASEAIMQQLIREEFVDKGCTVVAVAHRLRGVMDFGQVVVLSGGRVVERGRPGVLVGREGSVFGGMCVEQGIEA